MVVINSEKGQKSGVLENILQRNEILWEQNVINLEDADSSSN